MKAAARGAFSVTYIRWAALLLLLFSPFFLKAQTPTANFTANTVTGCTPLIVTFTDQSSGTPTSWLWDLGNGVTSTAQNPSTFYTSSGTYTVSLTVTNAAGSNTTIRTNYITVNVPPTVNFTSDVTSGCFPLRAQFTDASIPGFGVITSWRWAFGNGDTSNLQNPSYTYNTSGSYLVSLTVTNSAGCTQTLVRNNYIIVSNGVTADFTVTPPVNCSPPETFGFNNLTVGPATLSYQWDFGDGSPISTATSPSHLYTSNGPFTVRLIAASTQGCIDTIIRQNIVQLNNFQPGISSVDSACSNTAISFQNTSIPLPAGSLWDFGNGNTSTDTNPVTNYALSGTYIVQLINQYGSCNDTITKNITILPRPVAGFISNNTISCRAPHTVNFTNQTTGATSYIWDFGDGNTSTTINPTHTYTATGNYTVTLIALNSSGCTDTLTRTNYVRIQTPLLNPLFSSVEGCAPLTINMQANSSSVDNIASWFWDFGNGNTSTLQNPTFTFDSGSYSIKLRIVTTQGCSDSTRFDSIRVGVPPAAAFTAIPNPACAFQQIQFTDLSTGNPDQWAWDFRNGGGSILQNPLYSFDDTTGTFRVLLIAYNNRCADSVGLDVEIVPPVARFTYNVQCTVNKRAVNFVNQSSYSPAATFVWNFGDGSPVSALGNPTHTYAALGTYTVSLTVTDGACSNTINQVVRIVDELADFNASSQTVCKNELINFTSTGYNPANVSDYYWNFGDSFSATTANAQHSYTNAGTYTVLLAITDINGCRDTVTKSNYIRVNGPTAAFTIQQQQICLSNDIVLINNSTTDGTNAVTSAVWQMGNGISVSSLSSPFQYRYPDTGLYSIRLVITDAAGCTDSVTNPAVVSVIQPFAAFLSDSVSCPGAQIQFTNQTTGGTALKTYQWNFGDGSPASGLPDPMHTFAMTGVYNVSLIATEPIGCADTITRTVTVNVPVASFTVNDTISICQPFQAQFTNTSSFASSYQWNFGDGIGTSSNPNPTYLYAQPGTYSVRLIVFSPGNCTDTVYRTIRIAAATGTLSYQPLSGCNPLTATLQVRTGVPLEYTWDFGDGNTLVSNDSNQTHIYGAGFFVPRVIIRDRLGCVGIIQIADTIRAFGSNPNFGIDTGLFCNSGTVQFIDSTYSSDQITSYLWDFGDGNTSTSLTAPSHTYTAPGLYDVRLTVTTLNSCINTITKPALIRVVTTPSIAILGDTSFCAPADILLQTHWLNPDTSVINWQWNIDGTVYNTQTLPTITRLFADTITAQLIAVNNTGCSDTAVSTIVVHAPPPVFAGNDTTICVNTSALLTATGAQTFIWNSSPTLSCTNCTTTTASPITDTQYFVTGTSQYGCSNTDSVLVRVKHPFTIGVSANDTICVGETLQLLATGAENYSWAPATGLNNAAIANPLASPVTTTTYTVTGFDSSNCFTDVASVTIFVYNYPTVNAGNDTIIIAGTPAQLLAIGSADITSLIWSPASSLNCTNCNNPIATPLNNTTYRVEVSNIAGCSVFDEVTVFVGCLAGRIYIPNAFTPNNDGRNDRFYVIGNGVEQIKRMVVFDRWGKEIYSKTNIPGNNPLYGWDGSYKGIEQPPGVYAYIAEIVCGDGGVFKMHGTITLIR